jgi:serine/threonine protein kinase
MYLEYADYGNGERLMEEMKNCGGFNEAAMLDIMSQLTGALAVMHKEGWAHRDIKPANIFVFSNSCIKLGDFGCTKRIFDPDDPNTVLGTPAYTSPEVSSAFVQDLTMSSYDPFMSDIYSLGSSFFSLATFRDLSGFDDVTDEESERLFKEFVSNSLLERSFSQDLVNLIVQMLSQKAKDRPKAQQVLDDIKRLQGFHESLPPPPSLPQEPIVVCLKCHNPKSDNEYLTLACDHRMCRECFSNAIELQAPQLSNNREFRCPLCACLLDPIFITNNQHRLSRKAALQATIVTFLSFESPCPKCPLIHPMFVRGKKIKKVKPQVVHCSCGAKFCSFCSHKGKHKRVLIWPTTHCPHFDPKQYS